jgi:hypothetical protein
MHLVAGVRIDGLCALPPIWCRRSTTSTRSRVRLPNIQRLSCQRIRLRDDKVNVTVGHQRTGLLLAHVGNLSVASIAVPGNESITLANNYLLINRLTD